MLVIDLFPVLLIVEGFIKLEGLRDLVMLLLVGLGLADVVTEPVPLVSREKDQEERRKS